MSSLLLFNPENDIALASGHPNFTPAKEPLKLASDGSLLPFWWANTNDLIITDSLYKNGIIELISEFGLNGDIYNQNKENSVKKIQPWGWSNYTKKLLIKRGINTNLLPSDVEIDTWRQLSHRNITIEIIKSLNIDPFFYPVEAKTTEEAYQAIENWQYDAVIKQPWSSSGRGIFYTDKLSRQQLQKYIVGFINKQGSVLIEKRREKIKDFALLYHCTKQDIEFKGLSYFHTTSKGEYLGNIIETNDNIIDILGHNIYPVSDEIGNALRPLLIPKYEGWVGIDMMIETQNGKENIVPCVELNLRMTMGVVAHIIAERLPELRKRFLRISNIPPTKGDINLSPVKDAKYFFLLSDKMF